MIRNEVIKTSSVLSRANLMVRVCVRGKREREMERSEEEGKGRVKERKREWWEEIIKKINSNVLSSFMCLVIWVLSICYVHLWAITHNFLKWIQMKWQRQSLYCKIASTNSNPKQDSSLSSKREKKNFSSQKCLFADFSLHLNERILIFEWIKDTRMVRLITLIKKRKKKIAQRWTVK